jgi:hypothetical protein
MTFAAYHIDDYGRGSVILAIGENESDVRTQAIRRVLSLGVSWGAIQVQQRDELADIAPECAASLDAFFASKGASQ